MAVIREAITDLVFRSNVAGAREFQAAGAGVITTSNDVVAATARVETQSASFNRALNSVINRLDPYAKALQQASKDNDILEKAVTRQKLSQEQAAAYFDIAKQKALAYADALRTASLAAQRLAFTEGEANLARLKSLQAAELASSQLAFSALPVGGKTSSTDAESVAKARQTQALREAEAALAAQAAYGELLGVRGAEGTVGGKPLRSGSAAESASVFAESEKEAAEIAALTAATQAAISGAKGAETALAAQVEFNKLLGVRGAEGTVGGQALGSGAAAASASVFAEAEAIEAVTAARAADIASLREAETALAAQAEFNKLLGVRGAEGTVGGQALGAGSAAASASVFAEADAIEAVALARTKELATLKEAETALAAQAEFNRLLGVKGAEGTVGGRVLSASSQGAGTGLAFADAAEAEAKQAAGLKAVEDRVTALRDKINPLAVVQRNFNTAVAQSNALLAAGDISYAEHVAAVNLARAGATEAAKAMNVLTEATHGARTSGRQYYEGAVILHELLRGNFKLALGSVITELQYVGKAQLLFNPWTLGILAIVGSIAALTKATADLDSARGKIEIGLRATGNAAGVTANQLDTVARNQTKLSAGAARGVIAELLSGGDIGGDLLKDLLKTVPDFAAVIHKNADQAAQELNKIFSDPAKGAKTLSEILTNLLTPAERHHIEALQAAGQLEHAQQELFSKYNERVAHSTELTSGWDQGFKNLKKTVGDFYDSLGRSDRPPTTDDRIAHLRAVIAAQRPNLGNDIVGAGSGVISDDPIFAPRPPNLGGPPTIGSTEVTQQLGSGPDPAAQLRNDLRIRGHEEDDAGAQQKKNQELGRLATEYDELTRHLNPLIKEHEELTAQLDLADRAIKEHVGDLATWEKAHAALQARIDHLRTPVKAAEDKLKIELEVNALPPALRSARRAKLTAIDEAEQNKLTSGDAPRLGQTAEAGAKNASLTAAKDAVKQSSLQADAEVRLAAAAGQSSEAIRKATIENQVAAFSYQHAGLAVNEYRAAITRASEADRERNLNAVVLGLSQQADASERVAAVAGQGAAAVHKATLENQAFAEALKHGKEKSDEFKVAYKEVLDQLQRKDTADTTTEFEKELRSRQAALALVQAEVAAQDTVNRKHNEDVAILALKAKLLEQFPTFTDQELTRLAAVEQARAKEQKVLDDRKQAEKDFDLVARQSVSAVIGGFEDMVLHAKSFRDVVNGLQESLLKIGFNALVQKPLEEALTGNGSGGASAPLGGLLGQGLASLKGFFGIGGGQYNAAIGPGLPGAPDAAGQYASAIGPGLPGSPDMMSAVAKLDGSAVDLAKVPDIIKTSLSGLLGKQLTGSMMVQAASVVVNGGVSSGGGGGLGGLFGGGGDQTSILGASGDSSLTSTTAASSTFESGGMGAFTSEAAMVVPAAHTGGLIGTDSLSTRTVSSRMFVNAPRLHGGADLASDEIPAILQVGERVLSRKQAASYGANGFSVGAMHIHVGAGADPNLARRTGSQAGRAAAYEMGRAQNRNS